MKVRAIGYGRYGTGHELMVGQELGVMGYARNHGMLFTSFHCDYNANGPGNRRAGLTEAFDELAAGKACVLIVTDIDRLGRNLREILDILNILDPLGVDLHEVSSRPVDILALSMKLLRAAQQSQGEGRR